MDDTREEVWPKKWFGDSVLVTPVLLQWRSARYTGLARPPWRRRITMRSSVAHKGMGKLDGVVCIQ